MPHLLSFAVAECARRHKRNPIGMAIFFCVLTVNAIGMSYSFPPLLAAFLNAKSYLQYSDVVLAWGLVVTAALFVIVMWTLTAIVAIGWKVRNRLA
ncbi:hypothetical protein ABEG10_38430 (plasmid) [Burkholderia cenocepacia]|uniref:hypothetical protein n=1 Tax=Burkholderia cenocepacia TaxID=95486 RepID=UPI0020A0A623|nr:hypothetical protein [Burkholderia cenocepacia]MCO8402831.1 hypothetical protein [Burkholderia cenocepacia]MCO8415070.1 hypothetical protein [Burkholderia cenocepacia]MCO8423034.1 hypothetical protein [Burkholderia cenocepacia]MCO8474817.1 hypothetical protein [Burkholderia cenocepacia]MCO8482003.1 hypothetical protein [Burkholderia cenocepacia]